MICDFDLSVWYSVAAVVIQKHWRGYQCRVRKCPPEHPEAHGRCSPTVVNKLGMALPESSDRDYAATVIQVWLSHLCAYL